MNKPDASSSLTQSLEVAERRGETRPDGEERDRRRTFGCNGKNIHHARKKGPRPKRRFASCIKEQESRNTLEHAMNGCV